MLCLQVKFVSHTAIYTSTFPILLLVVTDGQALHHTVPFNRVRAC